MPNSPLVTRFIPAAAGNFTKNRTSPIKEITIHHMAGNLSVERLGELWANPSQKTSSHYGVNGVDIGQYVNENDTAWCNGNWDANCRAVSIEVANSCAVSQGDKLNWPVSEQSLDTLVKLVADIAKRNQIHPLVVGKSLTWHSMYAATACPGPYLMSKIQQICDRANAINAAAETEADGDLYGVMRQVIALTGEKKAQTYADKLNAEKDGGHYKIVKIIK